MLTLALLGCSAGAGDAPGDGGAGARDGAGSDVDGGDAAATDGSVAMDAGPPGPLPAPEPADPVFPDTIGTLTIAMRTGTADTAGTDDPIEVCLTETDCFRLNTPEIDDRQPGETDEMHLEGIGLARSAVDRVVIRSGSDPAMDNDRWTPACVHLRFDGEPVYCRNSFGVHIGTGTSSGETASWTDPDGLHQDCRSCWDDRTLTHGPMLGAPGPTSARVWVRADATRKVALRVGSTEDLDGAPVVDWLLPSPEADYTGVLEVNDLLPDERYYYRVEVAGDASGPVRPIRHSLPATTERVRMGFGSCTKPQPAPSLAVAASMEPDLFFFIGDNHYGNTQHLDGHRWWYRKMRLIPERAALMGNTPTVAIWDDHDFLANNSHGACARREHALQGFTEYWANPAYGLPETPGVFFRHREGPMELFALDCRMYRPDVGDAGSRCELATDPPDLPMSGGPIGAAQMGWLMDAVAGSDAPFKLLACGSRFTAEGGLDSWAPFDEARAALHDGLHERGVEGVVFLSGDIHRTLLRTNPRTSGYAIPEIASSPLAQEPRPTTECPAEPGQRYCIRANNVVMLDVTPDELTVTVHGEGGELLHTWAIPHSQLAY